MNWERLTNASKLSHGADWLVGFQKRHPSLSLRQPQGQLGQQPLIKQTKFFTNLAEVIKKHHFTAKDIWNVDETVVTTVQNPEEANKSLESVEHLSHVQ